MVRGRFFTNFHKTGASLKTVSVFRLHVQLTAPTGLPVGAVSCTKSIRFCIKCGSPDFLHVFFSTAAMRSEPCSTRSCMKPFGPVSKRRGRTRPGSSVKRICKKRLQSCFFQGCSLFFIFRSVPVGASLQDRYPNRSDPLRKHCPDSP